VAKGDVPALTPDTVLDGRYRLKTPVSCRGPVTLWRGDDEILARAVAVRVVEHPDGGDPERAQAARLLLDAAINSGRLVHPGAASTYDATTTTSEIGQVSYVVSEWVDGRTLRQVASGGTMSPDDAAKVVRAAARVVAAAHERGIHHGDLDPGNVIVSQHGTVKVIDIETGGVLAALGGSRSTPEDDPKRADVKALGGLLYAALTGTWPLDGDCGLPAAPSAEGRLRTPRQVRSGVPRDLDAVTLATLGDTRAAGSEIVTAAELVDELAAIAPGDAVFDPGLVSFGDTGAFTGTQVMPAGYGQATTDFPPPGDRADAHQSTARTAVDAGYLAPARPNDRRGDALRRPEPHSGPRGGYGPPPPQPDRRGPRRWRLLPLVMAGALLVALVVILAVVIPGGGDGQGGSSLPSPSTSGSGTASTAVGAALPAPVAWHSFDPPPGGDGIEKDDRVKYVLDGDPNTTWETEGYIENMGPGGIKDGVGFLLDYGQPVAPREIQVRFAGGPTSFQLLAGDSQVNDVNRYAIVASESGVNGSATVPIKADGPHRFWVVWLTSLPVVDGAHRGTVVDVTLRS
jgi:hypothetical protein